jgi:hypothetical protein
MILNNAKHNKYIKLVIPNNLKIPGVKNIYILYGKLQIKARSMRGLLSKEIPIASNPAGNTSITILIIILD